VSIQRPAVALLTALLAAASTPAILVAGAEAPFIDAVKRGAGAKTRALIKAGADVNAAEADGTTPLHWAVHRDDTEMARVLLASGARAKAVNRYGVAPLALACINGSAAMAALLIDAGADPNAEVAEGETALMTAARSGALPLVKTLVARGASINVREDWRGQSALMWAAAEGHTEVVEALLEAGGDLGARSNGGFTPLLFAAREGRVAVARTLLDRGADVNDALRPAPRKPAAEPAPEAQGVTALILAAGNAHYDLATLLLERGADPNAAPRGWTALHQMSWVRKAGIAGSNNPAPEGSGEMDSLEFVRRLVKHGADVNARVTKRPPAGITRLNMIGGTPFLLAARTADAEFMRVLAELGADPLATNADGTAPLLVAAGIGTAAPGEDPGTEPEVLEAVRVALELGADINGVDKNGDTAMHGAASKHVPSVVEFLARSGARVEVWNQKNKEGFTPLRIAEGVHRGMNILSSPVTAAAIRKVLQQ
jgi:ankyrin repeat protein